MATPLVKLTRKGGVVVKEKKPINIEIGQRIKQSREAAGLTQETFAEMLGLGVKHISAMECGAVGVSLNTIRTICKVLAISSDTLLLENTDKNDVSVMAARLNSASAGAAGNYLMRAILIAVLGGVDPNGGKGKVSGILWAVLLFQCMATGLNILRVNSYIVIALYGVILLFSVAVRTRKECA